MTLIINPKARAEKPDYKYDADTNGWKRLITEYQGRSKLDIELEKLERHEHSQIKDCPLCKLPMTCECMLPSEIVGEYHEGPATVKYLITCEDCWNRYQGQL